YFREILTTPLHQVFGICDDSHAGDVILEWNVPEPSRAAGLSPQDQGRSSVKIRFAMRTLEVRIEHRLLEFRITHAPAKLVRKHGLLPCRIHNDLRVICLNRPVIQLGFNSYGSFPVEQHSPYRCALEGDGAQLLRMFEQELVKLRARDLPGYRAL